MSSEVTVDRRELEPETELLTINMGPHHPATHGVLRLIVELEGEIVRDLKPVTGYLHTGIEKSCEDKSYWKVIPFVERMDYLSYYFNMEAFCGAVERLLGLEIPPRAKYLRVIHMELNRIHSHLVWLGTTGLDLGAVSMLWYCFRERDKILDRNEIFLHRTRNIGIVPRERLLALGVTGPLLRAAGEPWDLRKAFDYLAYPELDFQVPVGTIGDGYDRYRVRMAEIRESVKIIDQALEGLPEGPHIADERKFVLPPRSELPTSMEALIHHFKLVTEGFRVPPGEIYYAVEGPRGELGCYVLADGSARPARVHVRDSSFVNLQSLRDMCIGGYIADLIQNLAMLDPILGGVDR